MATRPKNQPNQNTSPSISVEERLIRAEQQRDDRENQVAANALSVRNNPNLSFDGFTDKQNDDFNRFLSVLPDGAREIAIADTQTDENLTSYNNADSQSAYRAAIYNTTAVLQRHDRDVANNTLSIEGTPVPYKSTGVFRDAIQKQSQQDVKGFIIDALSNDSLAQEFGFANPRDLSNRIDGYNSIIDASQKSTATLGSAAQTNEINPRRRTTIVNRLLTQDLRKLVSEKQQQLDNPKGREFYAIERRFESTLKDVAKSSYDGLSETNTTAESVMVGYIDFSSKADSPFHPSLSDSNRTALNLASSHIDEGTRQDIGAVLLTEKNKSSNARGFTYDQIVQRINDVLALNDRRSIQKPELDFDNRVRYNDTFDSQLALFEKTLLASSERRRLQQIASSNNPPNSAPNNTIEDLNMATSPKIKDTVGNEPIVDTVAPIVDTSEPIIDNTAPIIDTSEPIIDNTAPIIDTSEPIIDNTAPIVDTVAPIIDTSSNNDNTAPIVDTSSNNGSARKAIIDALVTPFEGIRSREVRTLGFIDVNSFRDRLEGYNDIIDSNMDSVSPRERASIMNKMLHSDNKAFRDQNALNLNAQPQKEGKVEALAHRSARQLRDNAQLSFDAAAQIEKTTNPDAVGFVDYGPESKNPPFGDGLSSDEQKILLASMSHFNQGLKQDIGENLLKEKALNPSIDYNKTVKIIVDQAQLSDNQAQNDAFLGLSMKYAEDFPAILKSNEDAALKAALKVTQATPSQDIPLENATIKTSPKVTQTPPSQDIPLEDENPYSNRDFGDDAQQEERLNELADQLAQSPTTDTVTATTTPAPKPAPKPAGKPVVPDRSELEILVNAISEHKKLEGKFDVGALDSALSTVDKKLNESKPPPKPTIHAAILHEEMGRFMKDLSKTLKTEVSPEGHHKTFAEQKKIDSDMSDAMKNITERYYSESKELSNYPDTVEAKYPDTLTKEQSDALRHAVNDLPSGVKHHILSELKDNLKDNDDIKFDDVVTSLKTSLNDYDNAYSEIRPDAPKKLDTFSGVLESKIAESNKTAEKPTEIPKFTPTNSTTTAATTLATTESQNTPEATTTPPQGNGSETIPVVDPEDPEIDDEDDENKKGRRNAGGGGSGTSFSLFGGVNLSEGDYSHIPSNNSRSNTNDTTNNNTTNNTENNTGGGGATLSQNGVATPKPQTVGEQVDSLVGALDSDLDPVAAQRRLDAADAVKDLVSPTAPPPPKSYSGLQKTDYESVASSFDELREAFGKEPKVSDEQLTTMTEEHLQKLQTAADDLGLVALESETSLTNNKKGRDTVDTLDSMADYLKEVKSQTELIATDRGLLEDKKEATSTNTSEASLELNSSKSKEAPLKKSFAQTDEMLEATKKGTGKLASAFKSGGLFKAAKSLFGKGG